METTNDYLNYLTCFKNKLGKRLSNKTIRLKLIIIKVFFKYLLKYDYVLSDPTKMIELPREEKDLPRNILSEEEVKEILTSIRTNTPLGLRNKAILELLYSSGIRTSELANLKIPDVDLKENTLMIVKGKGNKSRLVPIGQHASFYIDQYLIKARKFLLRGKLKDDRYLFLSENGKQLNKETVNKSVIRNVMKHTKIKKRVTCYTFRHSVASHLVKNKVDIKYVGDLLGHNSLRTTQKYVHLDINDLKKMHSMYHPREQEK